MRRILIILPVIAAIIIFGLYAYLMQPHMNGYVSDEIWYVSAARNFINEVGLGSALARFGVTVAPYPGCAPLNASPSIYYGDYGLAWFNKSASSIYGFALRNSSCTARLGYYYPDKSGILTYINLEHPWLAKYFIAAAMLWIGDYPAAWRVPSILLSMASLALTYLAALTLTREAKYAALAMIVLLMDATFRDAGILAMLDAYVGFFTILSVYLYLRNASLSSAVAGGLGMASKYPGAFPVLALTYVELYGRGAKRGALFFGLAFLLYLIPQIPIIYMVGGIHNYIADTLFYLKWFTESRPPGPIASNPLDWLIGLNSFVNDYSPPLYASGLPGAYLVAIVFSILMLEPHLRARVFRGMDWRELAVPASLLASWLGYWAVYAAGNYTLYSYYTIQFAALVPLTLVLAMQRANEGSRAWIMIAAAAGIGYGIGVQWRQLYSLIQALA
ncbi:MAG: phospholipid carrier-dependent glycosyltransferase [Thermocladium sp.]|jgi:predicted membrane-bound dolichyl-phosphate-mannose-protein mannosyltransferase